MSQKEQTPERHRIARQYLKQYSNCNRTAIARLLVDEHPLIFEHTEQARNVLKYVSGNLGEFCRKKIKDKSMIKETKAKNIYGLMDEDHNDFTPHVIKKPDGNKSKLIGAFMDVHLPFQDNRAVESTLDYFKKKQVDSLVINGDLIDFYAISRFQRMPSKRDLRYEIDAAKSFLSALRSEFPHQEIIYKSGNHEDRWKYFLMLKAPEIFRMSEFRLDIILNLPELKIDYVDDKRIIKAGKLNIIHGHEYPGAYSPVNPAKAYFNRALTSVMAGHNHQTSEHIQKDANDHIIGAWSVGCLCEMHPLYMPLNKWNLGFATIDLYETGRFRVINKKILDGEII